MKKRIKLLLLLSFGIFFLVGCSLTTTTSTTTISSETGLDYDDFSSLMISNPDDQLSMPEETYYLYYYGVTCGHCMEIKQEVLEIISNLTFSKVYLVESNSVSDIHPSIQVTKTPSLVRVTLGSVDEIFLGSDLVLAELHNIE